MALHVLPRDIGEQFTQTSILAPFILSVEPMYLAFEQVNLNTNPRIWLYLFALFFAWAGAFLVDGITEFSNPCKQSIKKEDQEKKRKENNHLETWKVSPENWFLKWAQQSQPGIFGHNGGSILCTLRE